MAKQAVRELLVTVILTAISTAAYFVLWKNSLVVTAFLAAYSVFLFFFLKAKRNDVVMFLVGAITGPGVEIIAISFGIWSYARPDFLGIPMWLPLVWGMFYFLTWRIAKLIMKLINQKHVFE